MKKYNCILIMFIVILGNIFYSNTLSNESSNALKTYTKTKTEVQEKIISISSLLCKGYKNYIFLITTKSPKKNYIYSKFFIEINRESLILTKKVKERVILKSYKMENLQKINKVNN